MANVGEAIAALQRQNDKQRQELQPRAGVVLEFGEHMRGIDENPLVTKVKDAIAELFATLRTEADNALRNAEEGRHVVSEAQDDYRRIVGAEQMEAMTGDLADAGRESLTMVRAAGRYITGAERDVLMGLKVALDQIKVEGRMVQNTATALYYRSEGVVQLSEIMINRLGGTPQ